jgi:hypothetical protein
MTHARERVLLMAGRPEHPPRDVAARILEDLRGQVAGTHHHPVDDGIGVAPEAERIDQRQPTGTPRIRRRELAGHHRAEGVPHQPGALESERLQQLVIAEDKVP